MPTCKGTQAGSKQVDQVLRRFRQEAVTCSYGLMFPAAKILFRTTFQRLYPFSCSLNVLFMRGLSCHVFCLIPVAVSELHCWLFPVQRCRSDPEWLAGTPRVLPATELEKVDQTAADRCLEEARETWINCKNAGLEAIDFALAPNVTLG